MLLDFNVSMKISFVFHWQLTTVQERLDVPSKQEGYDQNEYEQTHFIFVKRSKCKLVVINLPDRQDLK